MGSTTLLQPLILQVGDFAVAPVVEPRAAHVRPQNECAAPEESTYFGLMPQTSHKLLLLVELVIALREEVILMVGG